MNNYHIYEEIGRGRYSFVYKVSIFLSPYRDVSKKVLPTWQLKVLKNSGNRNY